MILDSVSLNMMAVVLFANLHPGLAETLVVLYMNCGLVPSIKEEAVPSLVNEIFTSSFPSLVMLRLSVVVGADPSTVQTPGAPQDVEESFEAIYDPVMFGEHSPKFSKASDTVMEVTDATETLTLPVPLVANPLIEAPEYSPSFWSLEMVPNTEMTMDATRSRVIILFERDFITFSPFRGWLLLLLHLLLFEREVY